MTKRSEGGIPVCNYCGFADTQSAPRQCCEAGADYDALAAENAALRVQIGKDCGDFDYPPGSAPCMCYFSTAEDRGPDPIGECHYHAALRKDAERYRWLRDRAWPFEFNGDTPEDADAAIDKAIAQDAAP